MGYLVPDLERLAARNVMALTPGGVYADLGSIAYTRVRRPIYPRDKAATFVPAVVR